MDATWITELRTAAASMLGIRALAERARRVHRASSDAGARATCISSSREQVFPTLRRATLFDRHRSAPTRWPRSTRSSRCRSRRRPRRSRRGRRGRHHRRDRAPARAAAAASAPAATRWSRARSTSTPRSPRTSSRTPACSSSTTSPSTATTASRATSPATRRTPLELAEVLADEAPHPSRPEGLRAARHRPGGRGRGGGDQQARGGSGPGPRAAALVRATPISGRGSGRMQYRALLRSCWLWPLRPSPVERRRRHLPRARQRGHRR